MTTARINTTENNTSLLDDSFLKALPMYNPGLVGVVRLPDLKLLFVNKHFEYYLGYSNDDLVGEGLYFFDLVEEYQRDHLLNQLSRVDESIDARSGYVIYLLKNKNGKYLPFYLYASPLPENDVHGKLYYILLHPDMSKWGMPFTSYDSKELFLEQFDGEHFGTFEWIVDIKKIFLSVGIYRIFDVANNHREVDFEFAKTYIHPNDLGWVEDTARTAFETGGGLNIEFRIVTPKHDIKLMHCLARFVKNEKGKYIKFAGSIRDITRQRAIESDLKNKIEELNHSNKELEEFAYAASHDMQEPLRKITTFSDRLSEKYKEDLSGDGAMYLSRMTAAAENMRTLINDLLEFSRISKTKMPFEPVDLNEILQQAKTDFELVMEETGAIIHSTELPVIDAISIQMKQLCANILGNAIKFRKAGVTPEINIESSLLTRDESLRYELPQGATYYKIRFTDNGIGFESEYAIRIFQVFQRLHGKSEYPGTGIGLAICKKIVEYHQGVIYAENLPGLGASFVFILPRHQQGSKIKKYEPENP